MSRPPIQTSTLMLNADGSIYHLNLLPEELADTVFLVGDPGRVEKVSRHFDHIEIKKQKREFITHTGTIGNRRFSVISTGIGTGNIDIVCNELDALVNIDFQTRTIKTTLTSLTLIRMGTCGALQKNVSVDDLILSDYAMAFDGLMHFYQSHPDPSFLSAMQQHFAALPVATKGYSGRVDSSLRATFSPLCHTGITLTCAGFYGPQGRCLRTPLIDTDLVTLAQAFTFDSQSVLNLEMETAAIYALGGLLGHRCCSISTVVANRVSQSVSKDPARAVASMIQSVLQTVTSV